MIRGYSIDAEELPCTKICGELIGNEIGNELYYINHIINGKMH